MFNVIAKIFLFCSAYCPLFLILLLQNYIKLFSNISAVFKILRDVNHFNFGSLWEIFLIMIHPTTLILIAFLSGLGFLLYILKKSKNLTTDKFKVINAKNITSESMTYIISYLVPFLSLKLNSTVDLLCILILIVTVGIIYINSDMLYINPLLNCIGYRTFQIDGKDLNKDVDKDNIFAIVPKDISALKENDVLNYIAFDSNMFIVIPKPPKAEGD